MNKTASDAPAILLIEDDEEIREGMVQFLRTRGYRVAWATNEQESILEITNSQLQFGLFLVDQKMKSEEALEIGRRLRAYVGTGKDIPVIVIPQEFSKEMEGRDEDLGEKDYKTYLTNGQQLENLLSRLLPPES